ncbi:MAG TPA: sialidase family protein [Pirellulaceae bacterium]|nr:sialidase family protein [Pirellulaceae bacterium]
MPEKLMPPATSCRFFPCDCPILLAVVALFMASGTAAEPPQPEPSKIGTEFIYENAPFPECHASTLAETKDGLIVAWFGGTEEKNPDVGIWAARRTNNGWTKPVEVANGVQADGKRHPCWNPVLFQMPSGPLVLFYKVGPSPSTWWGMRIESADGGKTWSKPERLPDDFAGPIKNKPVLLVDGTLLCGSSTEDRGWRVHMEFTKDAGKTWQRSDVLCDGKTVQAIQPTILLHSDERLQMLCRARSAGRILSASSADAGKTWTELAPTELPNPNSGIDGVTLADGRHLLVYNHTPRGRSPLNVAVSKDGKTWEAAAVLESEPGEYSYPAVIQTADGKVHITYTWKRKKIRHVTLDPEKFVLRQIVNGKWPGE